MWSLLMNCETKLAWMNEFLKKTPFFLLLYNFFIEWQKTDDRMLRGTINKNCGNQSFIKKVRRKTFSSWMKFQVLNLILKFKSSGNPSSSSLFLINTLNTSKSIKYKRNFGFFTIWCIFLKFKLIDDFPNVYGMFQSQMKIRRISLRTFNLFQRDEFWKKKTK